MNSTLRQLAYLLLSILGVVLTWWHNLAWFADGVGDKTFSGFWAAAGATHISSSLAWDIVIVAIAGLILVIMETKRLGMSRAWPFLYLILANGIAAAFALPLFLLFRERKLAQNNTKPLPDASSATSSA